MLLFNTTQQNYIRSFFFLLSRLFRTVWRPTKLCLLFHYGFQKWYKHTVCARESEKEREFAVVDIIPRTSNPHTHTLGVYFDYFHPPYLRSQVNALSFAIFFICSFSFCPVSISRWFCLSVHRWHFIRLCYSYTKDVGGSTDEQTERATQNSALILCHRYRSRWRCSILPSFPFSILMFSGCNIMFLYFSSGIHAHTYVTYTNSMCIYLSLSIYIWIEWKWNERTRVSHRVISVSHVHTI